MLPLLFTIYGIPPTVNTYWRKHGNRFFISKDGQEYKRNFALQAPRIAVMLSKPIEVSIIWYRPDNRRRDCDNILKSILDCLSDCLIDDDSLIYKLSIDKSPLPDKKDPRIEMIITELQSVQR